MNYQLTQAISVIAKERKESVGLYCWIDQMDRCGSTARKAKVVDVTVRTFGDELVLVYVTEGDFRTYIPYSKGFECGSYQEEGSDERHNISLWSMIGTEEDRRKDQELVHGKKETVAQSS